MDLEGETPHLLSERAPCSVPEVSHIARALGITCQQVFERAYARVRHQPSFARAVLARYLDTPQDERVLPDPVRKYCDARRKKMNGSHRTQQGFCLGCMLNKEGRAGLAFAYALIYPESEKNDKHPALAKEPDLPMLEKLWLDLVDSGALEHAEEDVHSALESLDDLEQL